MNFETIDITIAGLREHYRRGDFTPAQLIELLSARSVEFTDNNIWIYRLSPGEIAPYLAALETRSPDNAPLYGIPFAIKDNIDLANVPTTAACAQFVYIPNEHAAVVDALINAGAIPLGKTNLDQFATGLNGTRSPYGECKNAFNADYISGGSSSGSAVAVALGLVSFALGTDTAGSGRVPAALNNIVGWKPSRGLLSTRGLVPACRSIDCISVFALTCSDIDSVAAVTVQYDAADPFSRTNPAYNSAVHNGFGAIAKSAFKFGVPHNEQLQFFGDELNRSAFEAAVAQLEALGGKKQIIDFAPFIDAARLLYEGPWVAERYCATHDLIDNHPSALLPVIGAIIESGRDKTAHATFEAMYELQRLRRVAETALSDIEFIATPTVGTTFTRAQLREEPIRRNSELGYYTNFMNLLDLSAIAVPTSIRADGLPFGITLFADRFCDLRLLSYAQQLHASSRLPLGALNKACEFPTLSPRVELSTCKVVVCGAHMRGLPFNSQLHARHAQLIEETKTAPRYRFFALAGGVVSRPGLIRDEKNGAAIAVEVWEMPSSEFGSFVAAIPPPLGIGKIEMANGEWLPGFICEGYAIDGAQDITELGGWRNYLNRAQ